MAKEYVLREGAQFRLFSEAFKEGEVIPVKYTCDGEDISPPLSWSSPPQGTKSLALIMYDPDAPANTFIHWVIYNMPPTLARLEEGVGSSGAREIPGVGVQGLNDFGDVGYGGPCPPRGHGPHRYYFALHALSAQLTLRSPVTASSLLNAMRGKVLGYSLLMGRYSRQ
ncbi:YbhB/YbcL family Raf kinase inhibitor-like protein [Acidilobus saccharovorans]|uniref:YbhB/YbcL family Raf kinase inhibitor-like protein n=1 Tax=Acidilobus saccharovorans TaxID=242703 RepID=UPI000AF51288|nr:YbhB/YbcL family Raf kinase inhibitor-like protein [Acidilobus saccharovorans]